MTKARIGESVQRFLREPGGIEESREFRHLQRIVDHLPHEGTDRGIPYRRRDGVAPGQQPAVGEG